MKNGGHMKPVFRWKLSWLFVIFKIFFKTSRSEKRFSVKNSFENIFEKEFKSFSQLKSIFFLKNSDCHLKKSRMVL